MGVIKFDRDFESLFNWDTDENPTTEQDYQNAVKNWTETEMNLVDALLWQPTTEYATGNIVKTPSLPSQYVLRCAEAGTSGSTEPDYSSASVGDTVTDGSVEWVIVSLATGNAADVDASNIGINAEVDNSEAWASAIGGGAIAEDDGRLVKGDTVYAVTSELASDIATNAEAIEGNAEAIATNTADITQNTTDIDIADKRISNIEKLLQGNLYDYQTDSNSAYTKSVPAGAMPWASLDSVGGRTVVWNQLRLSTSVSLTQDGITTAFNPTTELVTITNNSRTTNYSSGSTQIIIGTLPASALNHKMLITTDNTDVGIAIFVSSTSWVANPNLNTVFTNTNAGGSIQIRVTKDYDFVNAHPIGNTYSFHINIFDLTLMYGAGNEPSTVAEFASQFPASYYSYNAGQLMSAGVTEVKSVGINLAYYGDGLGVPSNTALSDATKRFFPRGKYFIGMTPTNYYDVSRIASYNVTNDVVSVSNTNALYGFSVAMDCVAGKSYTLNLVKDSSSADIRVALTWYGEDGTMIGRNVVVGSSVTDTAPSGARTCLGGAYPSTNNSTIKFSNFQIEQSSMATPYSAPFINEYPIPAEIQALEGYGWSARNLYNYIDFERKVFVQRVAKLSLAIADMNNSEDYPGWTHSGIKAIIGSGINTPLYNSLNQMQNGSAANANTNGGNDIVFLPKTLYGLTQSQWLAQYPDLVLDFYFGTSGLNIETDISAYLTDDNLISVEAGGTLTFENQNGDDYRIEVPSAETYMVDLQEAI